MSKYPYASIKMPLMYLERQMQQPPGYRKRGQGMLVLDEMEWRKRGSYEEIVDIVITMMQMEQLKKRISTIFSIEDKEMFFKDMDHRKMFCGFLYGKRSKSIRQVPAYAASVFLLAADEKLWDKVKGNVLDTGIYFDRVRLGSVDLDTYILFHAAKDVYNGTKHIRLSELSDKQLISDQMLRLIVNSFVMRRCGVEIIEWEV